jgi:ribose/xylose/arabinose/galactoside ABC-type transport system permease subunit
MKMEHRSGDSADFSDGGLAVTVAHDPVRTGPDRVESGRPSAAAVLRRFRNTSQGNTEVALIAIIALLVAIFTFEASGFASTGNVNNILLDASSVGIAAWAVTWIMIAAEIDISAGPAVAFWGVVFAKMGGLGVPLAAVLVILGSGLVGALAGWLRATLALPSFIVTLGLWNVYGGLAYYVSGSLPIPATDSVVLDFLAGTLWSVPVPVYMMLILMGCFSFASRRTRFGLAIYATGGNVKAARLSGIRVHNVQIWVFAIAAMMYAIVAIIFTAQLSSGDPSSGTGLEFKVIAAVVVGGTALTGGRGSLFGTFLGVLLIAVISNGLVLIGVESFLQQVALGLIVVASVLINTLVARHRNLEQH